MKKILSIILTLIVMNVFGQTFLPPRSSATTTVQDSRWRGLLTAYLPHTHGLTLNGGLDTLGAVFYDDSSRHIWMRDTSLSGGKVFSMLLKSGDAGVGTVTQVNAGFWMSFTSITTTGMINADSGAMAAYFPRRKDSTISFVTPTQMNAQGYLKTIAGISAGGDLTGTYPNPTILSNAVTFGKFQQIAAFSFVGNPTAGTANAQSSFFGYGLRWNNDTVKVDTNLLKSVFGSATAGINQLTGDGTAGPGGGSQAFTLATVNSNVFGSNTFLKFSVNAKGLVTAAAAVGSSDIVSALGYTPIQLSSLSSTLPIIYNNSNGNISMAFSTVTPGSYTNANITVDAFGRITAAGNGSGGTGGTNSNVGSGYRFAVTNTNNIKTLFCVGCTLDSTSNTNALTLTVTGGSGINQLTGDGTAGPGTGSQAFTLATVNGNVGTFGSATQVGQFTVNGKGLITAASAVSIQITESQVTNLSTDLASKQGALSNTGTGFRIFSPQAGIKTLFCVGCTLDSTTNANALTLTVTGGSGITQLTGDGTAGPGSGSQAFTLATVNGNVGSFGTATQVSQFTVNAKGLITAAANVSILITESQVTNLVTDLASKQGLLSNTGSGYRIFSPQTGVKTLFCVGCTIDSTTNANGLTFTVTGGGGGITQIKAKNPLFTVGTDSIALDTLRAPEIPYGNIYTRNSNFGSNEFLAVGNAVFSINAAGNIDLTSANSGTNSNYVRSQNLVDEVTQLPRYSRSMSFQAVNTGSGIALGTVKTGVRQSVGDVAAWVNLSASPMQVAIGNTSPTILTNSGSYTNGPTWTAGDSIQVTLTFSDSVAVATFKNISTNSATTTLTYNFVTSSSPFLPQISYWAYITFGGHQIVYSEADSSTSIKNPNELFAGTSKTTAYYATNFANRFGWQVGQSVPSSVISAGGSNMTNDYSRVFPQNLNQNPIYFLIEEPCNDARVGYGGSVSQAEKTVDSMIAVCRTRGIKFFLYGLPEDSTVTGPALNASIGLTVMDLYFRNKYPQNYINTWDSLVVTPGSDNRLKTAYYITDGIHPNGAAQTVIARIVARSLKYYKDRQANILNTDGLIQVSQGGYASINTKAVAAAIVGGGAVNVLPKYLASGGLTPSGFSDDGSTEFGAGSWYTTPVLKAGPSHVVTGSLYTMTFGSSFTNFFTKMPGGGTNDKIWGFNNNGGTFSGAKLTDGGSTAFTWLNVASSGTTLTSIALQGPTLVNGATSDGVDGFFGIGGGRFDKLGVNTTSVTDSWLILGAGSTTVSPIRFTVGPLKTTTFGGTLQYGVGADTSFYAGITRTALNILTRIALVDSNGIKSGNIPFANTSRYYTESANFNFLSNSLQVGTSTAIASSIATFTSTTQGLLIPRMSTTQVNAISSPAEGLFAYDNVLHAPYYYNGTAWTAFGGGGSQTWQQALTTGSTLNTTNTVVNTGQIFTWNNGGTGTIKHTGMLADTTNDIGLYAFARDSSMRRISFASLVQYLPADTLNAANGLTLSGTGLNHTLAWGGTLSGSTTIDQSGFPVLFKNGIFTIGQIATPTNWNPNNALLGSLFSVLVGTLNDNSTAASGTVPNAYATGITGATLTATNTSVTTTNAFTFYVNGAPVAGTNETITNSYSLGVNGTALFQTQILTPSIAFNSWQTVTSGTSATVNDNQTNWLLNPSTLAATYTITLPANPSNGQLVKLHFGGTITSGTTVVTTLTVSPNSGQTIEQTVAPITAVGGDCFVYAFNKATSIWYREK